MWKPDHVVSIVLFGFIELFFSGILAFIVVSTEPHQYVPGLIIGVGLGVIACVIYGRVYDPAKVSKTMRWDLWGIGVVAMALITAVIRLSGDDIQEISTMALGAFLIIFIGFAAVVQTRNPPQE